ncbi:nuclear transport factor 2 family protein [Gordonia rhizosphera]|uniref:Putative dehydratase n=1 Tax=Gordonia rhizosphera NBRC 16068 TaxID=1108045 RepID=K6V844_9ACTN|nr:nuclear transport factor 2 family protein [Gordonia rhizosphera]GAB92373.1 putative dehydratase [Gordonia rhizosphera NBRC 16068]
MRNDTVEALIAFEGIRRTKARYQYLLDTKQWDEWASLFTEDFRWETQGGVVVEGREKFVEMTRTYIDKVSTVHQVHAPVLDLLSPTTASGIWPMFDYVELEEGAAQGYGYYHETYRLEGSEWKLTTQFLSRIRMDNVEALRAGTEVVFSPLDVMIAATRALPGLA